jgi:predicted SnoaL-like aldol condensation-catalyzing enzyme
MSKNSDLVRTAVDKLFNQRDVSALQEYWADDYRQHNPMLPDGTSHMGAMITSLPENFSYEFGAMVSEGDLVMVHGRVIGFAPTPMIVVDIFRIRDGKIAEHWDVLQEEVPADKTASGRPMFPAA